MQADKLQTGKDFTQAEVEASAGEIIRKLYSDMAAGMFMSAYSLGTFSGPTIGGIIIDALEGSSQCIKSCEKRVPTVENLTMEECEY